MKTKGKLKGSAYVCVAVFLVAVAVISLYERTAKISGDDGVAVMSALLTISKGNYSLNLEDNSKKTKKDNDKAVTATQPVTEKPTTSSEFSEKYYNTFSSHSSKKQYPIYTKQFTVGGKKYENFYVKNNTDYDLNIGKTLKQKLGFKIDKSDLISAKKSNDIAYPRQIAMYLCRTVGQMSFPKIGNDFGGRDHTTVMHAHKKIEKDIKENTNTRLTVESLKSIITNKK